jgi:hypothetical protein
MIPKNLFQYALFWSPNPSAQRRCQKAGNLFPSWSWTGWHGEVDYDTIFRTEHNSEPYFMQMESCIQGLRICDQQSTRSIQSLVRANEKIAMDARMVGRTASPGSVQSDQ